jgi:hypothetical protein
MATKKFLILAASGKNLTYISDGSGIQAPSEE